MKNLMIALLALTSLSALASGEKIFNYIEDYTYDGPGCEVIVSVEKYTAGSYVKIRVTNGRDLAIFHSSTFNETYQEVALPNSYTAQTEFEGERRAILKITKTSDNYADIKVVEKRKVFGFWKTEREAACDIFIWRRDDSLTGSEATHKQ
jgi:hypothetical protein